MKRISLYILLLVGIVSAIHAERVDLSTASRVARNYYAAHGGDTTGVAFIDVAGKCGLDNLFVFVPAGGGEGFVVVSATTHQQPILAFSTVSYFSTPLPLNSNIEHVMQVFESSCAYLDSLYGYEPSVYESQWLMWGGSASPYHKPKGTYTIVGPLVTTTWNQSSPFNDNCPIYKEQRTVTGCVSTALAQILRYWRYPEKGAAVTNSKCMVGDVDTTLSAPETVFDWDNLSEHYDNNSTLVQKQAVAELMYYCGVSLGMMYDIGSNGGSGAYASDVDDVLIKLGYKNTAKYEKRNNSSPAVNTSWETKIKTEIDAARPVIYSGNGHCFICDGYDSDGNFHFNFGWGGAHDGYYSYTHIVPQATGIGGGAGDYSIKNEAIYGIEPDVAPLIVTPQNVEFNCYGDSAIINIRSTNSLSSWTASSSAAWLTLSATSGTGSCSFSTIMAKASHNTSGSSRTATITVTHNGQSKTVTITQPDGTISPDGTYGETVCAGSGYIRNSARAVYVRPECFGNFGDGQYLTSVSFSVFILDGYDPDIKYTVKIFENVDFSSLKNATEVYDIDKVLGREVYSQDTDVVVERHLTTITVKLKTPYAITTGKKFWIGIYSDKQYVIGYAATQNLGKPYFGRETTTLGGYCLYGREDIYRFVINFYIKNFNCPDRTEEQSREVCDKYTWHVNNTEYTTSGDYSVRRANAYGEGCDSVYNLHLTIKKSVSPVVEEYVACDSLRYGTTTLKQTKLYYLYSNKLVAANGCDSMPLKRYKIDYTGVATYHVSSPNPVVWNGNIYTTSGQYTIRKVMPVDTLCDSILTLNLVITSDNEPLGIDNLGTSAPRIYASRNVVHVYGAEGRKVVIYNTVGQQMASWHSAPAAISQALPSSGIYLVQIDTGTPVAIVCKE